MCVCPRKNLQLTFLSLPLKSHSTNLHPLYCKLSVVKPTATTRNTNTVTIGTQHLPPYKTTLPTVGLTAVTSPSLSLYIAVVLPAPCRPNTSGASLTNTKQPQVNLTQKKNSNFFGLAAKRNAHTSHQSTTGEVASLSTF